jgi:formate dehydrogenase maturation protein FdhE
VTEIRSQVDGSGNITLMRCPNCGAQGATEIAINLNAEDEVRFFHCRECESKWWVRDGEAIAFDDVLDLTAESEKKR